MSHRRRDAAASIRPLSVSGGLSLPPGKERAKLKIGKEADSSFLSLYYKLPYGRVLQSQSIGAQFVACVTCVVDAFVGH